MFGSPASTPVTTRANHGQLGSGEAKARWGAGMNGEFPLHSGGFKYLPSGKLT